jgi:hypothetical protein
LSQVRHVLVSQLQKTTVRRALSNGKSQKTDQLASGIGKNTVARELPEGD